MMTNISKIRIFFKAQLWTNPEKKKIAIFLPLSVNMKLSNISRNDFLFLNTEVFPFSKKAFSFSKKKMWSLGWEDPLEKGMATHTSILPWKFP